MEEILVFKTNAVEGTDLTILRELLNTNSGIKSWNFDFDDCDNIFRLVSTGISDKEVLKMLGECGIDAQVLE